MRPKNANVEEEASEIRAAIDKEKELGATVSTWDMFTNAVDRRRTVLVVCAVTLQAASGSMFIIAYKAYFLTMAAVPDPFAMSNFGRRRAILMTGLGFFFAWLTTFTAPYFINPQSMNLGAKVRIRLVPIGRTLEEIDEMFEAKLPAHAFRKYICIGHTANAPKGATAKSIGRLHLKMRSRLPRCNTLRSRAERNRDG
ncbi:hypothetical protein OQA88_7347 [Cercophora sp. LCS_1]